MLEDYIGEFKSTGNIPEDAHRFLASFGYEETAEHCVAVADKAKELAEKFDCDKRIAEQAGYLHDISVVIPNEDRIEFAYSQMIEVLAEEVQYPMIIHQKLSVVFARTIFGITDIDVLSAIGCHTTLKAKASLLDKVVFLADKIAWDQDGKPPYARDVVQALEESLDAAVIVYLNYLWDRRDRLMIIHPWLVEAREDMLQSI
jgi:predicted HD superfamily hydrolase involved in NAD metabolism